MSLNGVTFEKRTCRSRDDARIRSALFSDGKLTGCALTYAGANLTIGVGSYMVKGRQIAVDNPETIGSTPTYSNGYGRLKYVLNLATAASAATFAQGSAVWQYASTNSFAALTQQDINNGTDTLYEIEICRVKYTSGSISSIESQIGYFGNRAISIRNASGSRRVYLSQYEPDDTGSLSIDDAAGAGVLLQTSKGGTDNLRGLWLYGSNDTNVMSHFGHNATSGAAYMYMRYGVSTANQIYIESTSEGGKITLRNAAGVIGAEIVFDAAAGGQIKLYNASGTLKQTIG